MSNFSAVRLIEKKRDGEVLLDEEITWLIDAYTRDTMPDYQMSALAMAIALNGMTDRETIALTHAMARSGDVLDLRDAGPFIVDKHSTGGVGDKTSLVAVPIVAGAGVPVAKMSGRGLGFSGGTLDKLEAFPGFRSDLTLAEFRAQLERIGVVLSGQSVDLAPADGKLYALRDVTGTVPSLPLIASSIMSKKIAGGAFAIVLDVKVGNGAFMTSLEGARDLARIMVAIGRGMQRTTVALLSDMNQPLGVAVGNNLEVVEALDILRGGGPADAREHCLQVAAYMLQLAGECDSIETGHVMAVDLIESGRAFDKLKQIVTAQGGDASFADDPSRFPTARLSHVFRAAKDGYVARMHAGLIGRASVALGGGRARKGDLIDLTVGLMSHRNIGDYVSEGEPLLTVYANEQARLDSAIEILEEATAVLTNPVDPLPLFYGVEQ